MTAARATAEPAGIPAAVAPALLRWFDRTRRPLPWRRDHDPYRVWVAEILLQQTRVAQAIPYYERFLSRFPNLEALARARPEAVLKAWEGAGYYARARHLHLAARRLRRSASGRLPDSVRELEELPGIGPYTARAIASIAFGKPTVALEVNGARVASRWLKDEGDVRSPRIRARLEGALAAVLPRDRAGDFNEAVMELGETVCRPLRPRCPVCPVAFGCRARRELPDPGSLPRPRPRKPRPHVRAALVVLSDGGRWFVQRRPNRGLLGGLWEFPGGRIERGETPQSAARRELREETGLKAGPLVAAGVVRHAYSHFTVELHVFCGPLTGERPPRSPARRWVSPKELACLPIPKATARVALRLCSPASGPSRGDGRPPAGATGRRTNHGPRRTAVSSPRRAERSSIA